MATGGTDHLIRVYYLGAETPMKVSEMDAHTVRNKITLALSSSFFSPLKLHLKSPSSQKGFSSWSVIVYNDIFVWSDTIAFTAERVHFHNAH